MALMGSAIETLSAAGGQIPMFSPLGRFYQKAAERTEAASSTSVLREEIRASGVAPGSPLDHYLQAVALQGDTCQTQPLSELLRENPGPPDTPEDRFLSVLNPVCPA